MKKEFELREVIIEISIGELEEKIRQYYISQDETIIEIDVKCIEDRIRGQWSDAWQDYIGGYTNINAEIRMKRKIKALDKDRIENKRIDLDESKIKGILSILLKRDNLEVKSILLSYGNNGERKVNIYCEKQTDSYNKNSKRIDFMTLIHNLLS